VDAHGTMIDPIFERVFKRIYDKPCWRVAPGFGTFLTFEFGNPHIETVEPTTPKVKVSEKVRLAAAKRRVFINGDWHLWIYCCNWEVRRAGNLVGGSSSVSSIQSAAEILDGQKFVRFSMAPREYHCAFKFDLSTVLETIPYDRKSEQWSFYDRRIHMVLTLRADGYYSYNRSNRAGSEKWKPIQPPVSP
jgi:hypothetical protein